MNGGFLLSAKRKYAVWALLTLVLLLAGCLRWVRFAAFPPGLWHDEAYSLAEGQRLMQGGSLLSTFSEKHGEPVIIWLTALALRLGAGRLAPRWATSASSVVAVLLLFFAVRDVMRRESARADWVGLGAAAALAVNYEFLFHSRMSWHGALVATLFIPAVWLFWRGMRDGRCRDFGLGGVVAGIAQYAGVTARMLPLVLLLVLLGWLSADRRCWRTRWKGLVVAVGGGLLAVAPLLVILFAHPEWFAGRLHTAAPLSDILPNVGRTLAGWLWMGEAALHSLPGRPIYDPAMALLLLLGAGVSIWRVHRPSYSVWLAWFVGVLPGGFLSAPTPMFYRVMTAVPATAVLCALGGWRVWQFVSARLPRLRRPAILFLLGIFAISTWATCYDYFVRWANWPLLPLVMDVGKWRAAEVIIESPADETVLVTMPDGLEPVITYGLHARETSPARAFDGTRCLVYPARTVTATHYVVIEGYEHRTLPRLQALFPAGYREADSFFGGGEPYFVSFFVPPGAEVPLPGRLPFPIVYDDILLLGVDLSEPAVRAGRTLTVTLAWQPTRSVPVGYTVFVHLLDGEAADNPLRAQHDGPPCGGAEPTWRWQPGERILDEHVLAVPPDLPGGIYLLGVGLYDPETQERLVPGGEDLRTSWDEPIVGEITVVGQ